MRIQWST